MRQWRKKLLLILWILITISFSVNAQAAKGELKLYIISNHNNIKDGGHAFLELENNTSKSVWIGPYECKSGQSVYIGARGSTAFASWVEADGYPGGVFFDSESYEGNRSKYKKLARFGRPISSTSLSLIYEKMKGFGRYNLLKNNCADFAVKTWNAVMKKEKQSFIYQIGFTSIVAQNITQPSLVRQAILKMGGKKLKELPSTSDDFYAVTPGGHLQVWNWKKRDKVTGFRAEQVTCTSMKLSWNSVKREIGKNEYNITGYEIRYFPADDISGETKSIIVDGADSTSVVINNLKRNTNYRYVIQAISDFKDDWYVSKCPFAEYVEVRNVCTVQLSQTTLSLLIGKNKTLDVSFTCAHKGKTVPKDKIKWKSASSSVASVKKGTVTGLSLKDTTITAEYYGQKMTCSVSVTGTTISPKIKTLYTGGTLSLTAKTRGKSKNVTWKNSNSSIVSMTSSGNTAAITAKKKGTAKITATANGQTAACVITVKKSKLEIIPSGLIMEAGDTQTLKYKLTGIKKGSYRWSSSNKDVVTVSNKGKVTALAAGDAVITLKTDNLKASCKIKVNQDVMKVFESDLQWHYQLKSYSTSSMTDYSITYIPGLIIESVSGNNVSFRLESIFTDPGRNGHLVSSIIRSTASDGKTTQSSWYDSYGNSGTIQLTFVYENSTQSADGYPHYYVDAEITLNRSAYYPYNLGLSRFIGRFERREILSSGSEVTKDWVYG